MLGIDVAVWADSDHRSGPRIRVMGEPEQDVVDVG